MKKKNIVVDKIPEEYMIKSLGSGVSAECFLTSEGKVFKKYHDENNRWIYNSHKNKEHYDSRIFVFPEVYVFRESVSPENFIGYMMEYVKGFKYSELENSILIRDLINAVRMIEREIKSLTFQGLMFTDLNKDNIMFRTINEPKVIDTDLYEATYNDMFGDMFKENIKELAETIISDILSSGLLESLKMNRYILDCGCYGMVLPSVMMEELLNYAEQRLETSIISYGEYKNGLKMLKRKQS